MNCGMLRCSHGCNETTEGPLCYCPMGFQLEEDDRTCEGKISLSGKIHRHTICKYLTQCVREGLGVWVAVAAVTAAAMATPATPRTGRVSATPATMESAVRMVRKLYKNWNL